MKKLGTLQICGLPYDVFVGNWKDEVELKDNYGLCDSGNQVIWIREGHKPEQFKNTLIHEILHALIIESGARLTLGENAAETEEALIQILTPHLIAGLDSLAAWKKPRAARRR